jgi:hypothetical protein
MVVFGIFLTIHANLLLHRWFVAERDKPGEAGSTKEMIKKKVGSLMRNKRLIEDLFLAGNEELLIKVRL